MWSNWKALPYESNSKTMYAYQAFMIQNCSFVQAHAYILHFKFLTQIIWHNIFQVLFSTFIYHPPSLVIKRAEHGLTGE